MVRFKLYRDRLVFAHNGKDVFQCPILLTRKKIKRMQVRSWKQRHGIGRSLPKIQSINGRIYRVIIGIDLGTANSVVSMMEDGSVLGKQFMVAAIFLYSRSMPRQRSNDGTGSVIRIGNGNTDEVKLALVEFMQDKLWRLRLSWNPQSEEQTWYPFHIVLLQEDQHYIMVCLRDAVQQVEYYVADPAA